MHYKICAKASPRLQAVVILFKDSTVSAKDLEEGRDQPELRREATRNEGPSLSNFYFIVLTTSLVPGFHLFPSLRREEMRPWEGGWLATLFLAPRGFAFWIAPFLILRTRSAILKDK